MKKIILAGGSGFLGGVLTKHFQSAFEEVVILCRQVKPAQQNIRYVHWDGKNQGVWCEELNDASVIVNLAGRNVNCRYTKKNKKEILDSRINSTKALGEAIRNAAHPPSIWIQSASSTIYQHAFEPNDENSNRIGDDFSMTVCREWERTFWEEATPHTRKILLRTAIVLGRNGGAWPVLRSLAAWGLGGSQGNGNQMISWIHEHDFARVVEWLLQNGIRNGVYNVCSPNAINNRQFMRLTRSVVGQSFGLVAPGWLLELGAVVIGTETELVLKSRWVYPRNLLTEGFHFTYSDPEKALVNLVSNEAHPS